MLPDLNTSFNRLRAALRHLSARPPRPMTPARSFIPTLHSLPGSPLTRSSKSIPRCWAICLGPASPSARPTAPSPAPQPGPRAPFVAAYLVKLHEGKRLAR